MAASKAKRGQTDAALTTLVNKPPPEAAEAASAQDGEGSPPSTEADASQGVLSKEAALAAKAGRSI